MSGFFGTPVDQSAWTAYTPTVSANSGTFTSASATARYKQNGKTVTLNWTLTITTVGSGAIPRFSLPNTPIQFADGLGHEGALTGKVVRASLATTLDNLIRLGYYDNTDPAASGAFFSGSLTYEIA